MLSTKNLLPLFYLTIATALPISVLRREVPQEHSHEPFLISVRALLALDNPDNILDPVFGLLGNAAAQQGLGDIADPDCLQQATADQAFTNAKAAGDVQGQVDSLIFRALERNTGAVGQASALCTSITAVNPEIAAISQHQDPASTGAAAINKAIVLELARQIASVGGDPLDALKSGTFAPGELGDPTAAGNTCNDANNAEGCIFTEGLLVEDASEEEILAAVDGVDAGDDAAEDDAAVTEPAAADPTADCETAVTVTVTAAPTATASQAPDNSDEAAGNGQNLQSFTGALGGAVAPAVTAGGRGFEVANSDDFLNLGAALNRSCDIQHNACANIANSATGRAAGLSVGQCDTQNNDCKANI